MIRVVIADDHEVVRAGLELLIGTFDDVELVGTGCDGLEAVALCRDARPDVALLDIEMPTLDGIAATRRIHDVAPGTAVVLFTSFSERRRVLHALDAGAVGFLLKDATPQELHRAIGGAAESRGPLTPEAARSITEHLVPTALIGELTPREREILMLLGDGLANKQIARRLGITEKTVKGHLTKIFQTIGVTDRTQAALWAERSAIRADEASGAIA
jgi:DNA-binding NarL/FixJ family response regulator